MEVKRELLIQLREAKGLTQEQVAVRSNLDVRTVQRAEAGTPISAETLAQIAATLGIPNDELLSHPESDGEPPPNVGLCVLHPVQTPLQIISVLSSHQEADVDCLAETTSKGRAEAVLQLLGAIEKQLPTLTPNVNEPIPTVTEQLRQKVILEQQMNSAMQSLKAAGLGLYVGTFTDMMRIPSYDIDDGFWSISHRAKPKPVNILVLRIAAAGEQRLVVPKARTEL